MSEKGGWSAPVVGTVGDGHVVTASFGTGSNNAGETFLADGAVAADRFASHSGHDHYGSGNGPNNNGTERGCYTGPGSKP